MLTSLRLVNFKNFADETLKLGPFTVIVGANASGKSNIRDAFRFLHGIGRGYTLAEVMGGKLGPGGYVEWEPIRGAPNEIVRFNEPDCSFETKVASITGNEPQQMRYFVEIGEDSLKPEAFRIQKEELSDGENMIYSGRANVHDLMVYRGDEYGPYKFTYDQAALTQGLMRQLMQDSSVLFHHDKQVEKVHFAFAGLRFLELSPQQMREPSIPGANILGDHGQNLPTVLESICTDTDRKQTLLSWFEELTPMDVAGFEFPRDPSGRVHLYITERNGRKVSAYSASDGTLRFLGILAALLNDDAAGIYFFEEIDNGIHPNRLWLLLDLIERETANGKLQVITTTHSPALLAWINDETFEHTSVVYRDEYWKDSVIRPIADLYNLRELRKSTGLERLYTSGWIESAMKFSEGDADTDHLEDDDEDDWGMDEE